jgi:hypothetical protein
MAPADQRFRANQTAIDQTDLRLIKQLEFFAFDRERQFGFQLQPRLPAIVQESDCARVRPGTKLA